MSYPGIFPFLVGHPPGFQNIQAENIIKSLYCGQSSVPLVQPSFTPLSKSEELHPIYQGTNIHNVPQPKQNHTPMSCPTESPNLKKFRPPNKSQTYIPNPIPTELGNLKTYSNPDILICGNCRELFDDLVDMLDHKKLYCKMRFTCKCADEKEACGEKVLTPSRGCEQITPKENKVFLKCSQCKNAFTRAWDLLFHVQKSHGLNIYTLGENVEVSHNSFEMNKQ